jgi:hypothetical protein
MNQIKFHDMALFEPTQKEPQDEKHIDAVDFGHDRPAVSKSHRRLLKWGCTHSVSQVAEMQTQAPLIPPVHVPSLAKTLGRVDKLRKVTFHLRPRYSLPGDVVPWGFWDITYARW